MDPDLIWIDLCQNSADAKTNCQLFLENYAEEAVEMKPCIGTEESEEVRIVRSASTIDRLWRDLVGYANDTVLRKKREADPENYHKWTVKYIDVKQGALCGPVTQITQVYCRVPELCGLILTARLF